MSDITLIIPSYRNPKYLDLCLQSATENKTRSGTDIIVILDGYPEESEDVIKKYNGINVISLGVNKGMQYAINMGVMQATTEYVFIINDDNVMPNEWDKRLIEVITRQDFSSNPAPYVITVNQVEPTGPGMFNFVVEDLGQSTESFDYKRWIRFEKHISKTLETNDGSIFPFLMEKKYYLAVGGMDTFYNSPNVCDWDFFLKLQLLWFRMIRTHQLHLYHFGSVSTKKNAESVTFKQREAQAFQEYEFKWGTSPYNEPNTNSKIPPNKQFRGFKI